jgi:hypothetical protein
MYNVSLTLTSTINLGSYYISREELWIPLQVVHFMVNLQRTQMAVRMQLLKHLSIQTMFCVLNRKTGHWFQLKRFQLRLNHRLLGTLSQVSWKDVPSFDYSAITRSICNRDRFHTVKMKFRVNAQRIVQISLGVFQIIICLQVPLVGLCFCNAYKSQ